MKFGIKYLFEKTPKVMKQIGEKFTFISTAGGAMLDFLANETLPGIEALNK
jgi:3-phosphoglycerate kinase